MDVPSGPHTEVLFPQLLFPVLLFPELARQPRGHGYRFACPSSLPLRPSLPLMRPSRCFKTAAPAATLVGAISSSGTPPSLCPTCRNTVWTDPISCTT